jgi:hypothetical protein
MGTKTTTRGTDSSGNRFRKREVPTNTFILKTINFNYYNTK